jgi:hypothetical protein
MFDQVPAASFGRLQLTRTPDMSAGTHEPCAWLGDASIPGTGTRNLPTSSPSSMCRQPADEPSIFVSALPFVVASSGAGRAWGGSSNSMAPTCLCEQEQPLENFKARHLVVIFRALLRTIKFLFLRKTLRRWLHPFPHALRLNRFLDGKRARNNFLVRARENRVQGASLADL